ncbi:hypothetical protein V6R21_28440 [Limibacter armeniacum]|uniref:hypothetical protein n=1 Tax=Limibacter armeniacum TaxID=466084 RepID=UPI002FE5239B
MEDQLSNEEMDQLSKSEEGQQLVDISQAAGQWKVPVGKDQGEAWNKLSQQISSSSAKKSSFGRRYIFLAAGAVILLATALIFCLYMYMTSKSGDGLTAFNNLMPVLNNVIETVSDKVSVS